MCGLYLDWPVIAALQGFATVFLLCVFYRFWVSCSERVNSQRGFWCLCCRNVFLCRKLEQEVEQLDFLAHVFFLITQNRQRFVKAKHWPNFTSYPPPSALSYPPDIPRCVLCYPPPSHTHTPFSPPFLHPTNFACSSNILLCLSQRSFGWRTEWSSVKTPSFWCKTTRECWLWTSASRACSTGADTPAGPSTTSGKTRWSALWRFEVCRCGFHFPQQCRFKAKARPEVRASLSLAGFNEAHRDKSPSPQPLLPELLFRRKQNSFSCAKYKSPYCICQRKFPSHRWL